jgi:hypothetical protein
MDIGFTLLQRWGVSKRQYGNWSMKDRKEIGRNNCNWKKGLELEWPHTQYWNWNEYLGVELTPNRPNVYFLLRLS